MRNWKFGLATALAFAGAAPAGAIVGPARDETRATAHVVMLLKADARGAAFCTASVIAPDVLITAAHCVDKPEHLRVYWPGGDLTREVRDVRVHPGFRPDAPRTREVSIDLALVRTKEPLPSSFTPVPLEWEPRVEPGAPFTIVGYGLTRENEGRTGGKLHAGELAVRDPISKILIWATDPGKRGLGACTGDSGGPMLTSDGRLAAVTVWSQGEGRKHCGALTQAVRLGPQRDFIEKTLRAWRAE